MLATARRLGAASLLLGVASCSFLTDFPTIEGAGGAAGTGSSTISAGGAGGAAGTTTSTTTTGPGGGAPACVGSCTDGFDGSATAPLLAEPSFVIRTGGPNLGLWVTDGVSLEETGAGGGGGDPFAGSNGPWWTATFAPEGSPMLEPEIDESTGQHGLLLDASGTLLAKMLLCTESDTLSNEELFLNAVTATRGGAVVVAGGFEDHHVAFRSAGQGCAGTANYVLNGAPSLAAPFLAWFNENGFVDGALQPTTPPSGGTSYFSDVAAGSLDNEVYAIGLGIGAFRNIELDDSNHQFFVVRSSGPASSHGAAIQSAFLCDTDQATELFGLRSGIAVAPDGAIWVAGTACGNANEGSNESFLARYAAWGDTTPPTPTRRNFGGGGDQMSITRIATSDTRVIVAGTYTGTPVTLTTDQEVIEAGDDDGFVMAFERDAWNNQTPPTWFQRIEAQGRVRIEALVAKDGHVFVGGSIQDSGSLAEAAWCYDVAPNRERAFFADLSEGGGSLGWLRMAGFEASTAPGDPFTARGTALVPRDGFVDVAYTVSGEAVLTCGGNATTADPTANLATLDLQ